MNKILETVKDIIKNPAKYRKAAVVPVGAVVAVLSIVLGADSKVVLEVVSIAEGLGVYFVPNAKPVAAPDPVVADFPDHPNAQVPPAA